MHDHTALAIVLPECVTLGVRSDGILEILVPCDMDEVRIRDIGMELSRSMTKGEVRKVELMGYIRGAG